MTINASLSNALSGLTTAARRAELVSSNIANAMTEGYARRELSVSPRVGPGIGGVQVNGVIRHSDPRLLADRRLSDAGLGAAQPGSDFLKWLESSIGVPEDPQSVSALVADFEAALVVAESNPSVNARLEKAVTAAARIVDRVGQISDGIQDQRVQADRRIDSMVTRLNDNLGRVRDLNVDIVAAEIQGQDSSSLRDRRQALIDDISSIVPLRELRRDNGAVSLYTTGGATLLDVNPVEIGFTPSHTIAPHMTLAGGVLSGLTINGDPVSTSSNGRLGGGELSAQFAVRDSLATDAQAELDALSRDLVERFQDSSLDPTLAPGAAGLFTDAGAAFAPANETGLSGRLQLNALVDPAQGGAAWRLRDGLGAAAPGDPGQSALLNDLRGALTGQRTLGSGEFAGANFSAASLAERMITTLGGRAATAEGTTAFAAARQTELTQIELANGVDTDQEMQTLLMIEQAYAANAKVIQTVDEMIQALLRI